MNTFHFHAFLVVSFPMTFIYHVACTISHYLSLDFRSPIAVCHLVIETHLGKWRATDSCIFNILWIQNEIIHIGYTSNAAIFTPQMFKPIWKTYSNITTNRDTHTTLQAGTIFGCMYLTMVFCFKRSYKTCIPKIPELFDQSGMFHRHIKNRIHQEKSISRMV